LGTMNTAAMYKLSSGQFTHHRSFVKNFTCAPMELCMIRSNNPYRQNGI
jgi:hypothetical protein